MLARLAAAAFLALASIMLGPTPVACACSCAPVTTADALARSSAVFEGEVVAAGAPTGGFSAELVSYTITVSRVFKGSVPAQVVVRSEASEASCGIVLKGHVVVFASGASDDLRTTLCSVPEKLDRAELGEGTNPASTTPTPTASTTEAGSTPTPLPDALADSALDAAPLVLWTLAGLVAVAVLVSWLVRRR
ncbi:MAG: hypothetical protein IPL41_09170 [Micropruina sp.]|nr:hypothetical protein [Micropruina sp.]